MSGGSEDGNFDDFRSSSKRFQEFKQEIGDNASKSADLYEVSKALF